MTRRRLIHQPAPARPSSRRRAALVLAASLAAAACERSQWGAATLAPGSYELGPVWCASSLAPPNYPTAARKLALFAFDDLTTRRLDVAYPDTTLSLSSATCTLTLKRTLARNYDGAFALRHDRRHLWSPEGCQLRLSFDGVDYQVGADTTNAFGDSSAFDEEPTQAVVAHEQGSALTTVDRDDYHALWQAHGCGARDRLFQTLTPRGATAEP